MAAASLLALAREFTAGPVLPLDPYAIAPASARSVSTSFSASGFGGQWSVYQDTRWKDRDGDWDGDCARLAHGLSEAEARAVVGQLGRGS